MINDLLDQLGFSDKEILLYTTILQQGKVTASNLATLTKINRTTIYSVAKELINRGVITEDLASTTGYFVALPPTELRQLAEQEEKTLQEKKKIIDKAVMELQTIAGNAKYSVPKIVFIAEDKILDYLYKRTPVWNASMEQYDNMWWGFQDTTFVRQYEEWIDWYWEKGSSPTIELKLLSNYSAESAKRKKYTRRKIRFWKGSKDFTATIWVNGEYLVMLVTNQKPHYLVEIHDRMLAQNLSEIFKNIWTALDTESTPLQS